MLKHKTSRSAFTLFEVAIALLVTTTAVLSVLLVFPVGLKAQRISRFQVYASTKMLDMMDTFAQVDHSYTARSLEAEEPWANPFMAVPMDLDHMLNEGGMGLLPLPNEIAKRFDSDGDEIHQILEKGGRIFYTAAHPYAVGFDPRAPHLTSARTEEPPLDSQALIWAVEGYAQQNVLPNHPCVAWPYFVGYPSPIQDWEYVNWMANDYPVPSLFQVVWDGSGYKTSHAHDPAWWNDFASVISSAGNSADRGKWHREIEMFIIRASKFLFVDLGFEIDGSVPPASIPAGFSIPVKPYDLNDPTIYPTRPWLIPAEPVQPRSPVFNRKEESVYPKPWNVQALSFLAAAAQALTSTEGRYGTYGSNWDHTGAPYVENPPWGNPCDARDVEYARLLHERCMDWIVRYQATDPYDWGAIRATNQQHAWQYPLLQYDLFPDRTNPALNVLKAPDVIPATFESKNLTPTGVAGDPINKNGDTTWRIVAARKPTNAGPAAGYVGFTWKLLDIYNNPSPSGNWREPGVTTWAAVQNSWGDTNHFNATDRFSPTERCRQVVCWAVDWLSYRDSESCPAAPMDAKQCNFNSLADFQTRFQAAGHKSNAQIMYRWSGTPPEFPQFWMIDPDPDRNPLTPPPAGLATGASQFENLANPGVPPQVAEDSDWVMSDPQDAYPPPNPPLEHPYWYTVWNPNPAPSGPGNPETFNYRAQRLGIYGADRNGNGSFDQGPLGPGVRMRAITVARFNYYDRITIASLRN